MSFRIRRTDNFLIVECCDCGAEVSRLLGSIVPPVQPGLYVNELLADHTCPTKIVPALEATVMRLTTMRDLLRTECEPRAATSRCVEANGVTQADPQYLNGYGRGLQTQARRVLSIIEDAELPDTPKAD